MQSLLVTVIVGHYIHSINKELTNAAIAGYGNCWLRSFHTEFTNAVIVGCSHCWLQSLHPQGVNKCIIVGYSHSTRSN